MLTFFTPSKLYTPLPAATREFSSPTNPTLLCSSTIAAYSSTRRHLFHAVSRWGWRASRLRWTFGSPPTRRASCPKIQPTRCHELATPQVTFLPSQSDQPLSPWQVWLTLLKRDSLAVSRNSSLSPSKGRAVPARSVNALPKKSLDACRLHKVHGIVRTCCCFDTQGRQR